MKKTIFAAFAALLMFTWVSCTKNEKETPTGEITTQIEPTLDRVDTLTAMFNAFVRQESNGNALAVSPCGRYVGCLQISEIMVREANRVIGEDIYTHDDRYDEGCSFGIFMAVQNHHNPDLDIDRAIEIWNPRRPEAYTSNIKTYYAENLSTTLTTKSAK